MPSPLSVLRLVKKVGGRAPAGVLFWIDDKGTLDALLKQTKAFEKKAYSQIEKDLIDYTFELRDEVRKNAQGRPGPRKITGAYWNSIVVAGAISRGRWGADKMTMGVTSAHPAAHRLENGYVDVDAAGRHFNQPPYKHWAPALETVGQRWIANAGKNTFTKSWKDAK